MRFIETGCLALLLAPALQGCAFRTQTTGMAMEYNDFVADTTNGQTVLNILRARDHAPMHFTSFGAIRGTLKAQGSAEVGATLPDNTAQTIAKTIAGSTMPAAGGASSTRSDESTLTRNDNATALSPKLGVLVNTGTDFDIAVNNTDDFFRGITTPIKEALIIHYLRQGYPPDLIGYLAIGEIRYYMVVKKVPKAPRDKKDVEKSAKDEDRILVATFRNTPHHFDDDDRGGTGSKKRYFDMAMACRQLAYQVSTRGERVLKFRSLAELASLTPEVLAHVSSLKDAPGAYTYTVGASGEFKLAFSKEESARACGEVQTELFRKAEPLIGDVAGDLPWQQNTTGKAPQSAPPSDRSKRNEVPLNKVENLGESIDTAHRDQDRTASLGVYRFETEDFFTPLIAGHGSPTGAGGYRADLVAEVTLRSVEGMLYFLGEYIRYPERSPLIYDDKACPARTKESAADPKPCIPILRVLPKRDFAGPVLSEVSYRGHKYVVPLSGGTITPEAGRSSQTIGLIEELLNIHRTSKDLPTTPVVRVSN